MIELIDQENAQPFDIQPALVESTGNNITSLVFGGKLEPDSARSKEVFELLTAITKQNEKLISLLFIPFAVKVILRKKLS